MFDPIKTLAALEVKQTGFSAAETASMEDLTAMEAALTELVGLSWADLEAKLPSSRAGARPTVEYDAYPDLIVPFATRKERRNQRRHPPAAKPELETTGPKQLWSWDIMFLSIEIS